MTVCPKPAGWYRVTLLGSDEPAYVYAETDRVRVGPSTYVDPTAVTEWGPRVDFNLEDRVFQLETVLRQLSEDFAPTYDDGICDHCHGKIGPRGTPRSYACRECKIREIVNEALQTSPKAKPSSSPESERIKVLEAENADLKVKLQVSDDAANREWCRQLVNVPGMGHADLLVVAADSWGRDEALRLWTEEWLWQEFREFTTDEQRLQAKIKIAHERLDQQYPP